MELRIKELRKGRGWTQAHLAEMVGMSKSYLSELENHVKPINSTRIDMFARVFDVAPVEIIASQAERDQVQRLNDGFFLLSPEDRQLVLRQIEAMAQSVKPKSA